MFGQSALLAARCRYSLDPLDDIDEIEQQAASGGVGFIQSDSHLVAQAEALARPFADQHLPAVIVTEELLAEAPDR